MLYFISERAEKKTDRPQEQRNAAATVRGGNAEFNGGGDRCVYKNNEFKFGDVLGKAFWDRVRIREFRKYLRRFSDDNGVA